MAGNPRFRYFYVVWAFMECLFFGGLLYGWGSLVFVLKEDRVYSEVCDVYDVAASSQNSSVVGEFSGLHESSTVSPPTYSVATNSSFSASDVAGENVGELNLNCPERDKLLALVFTIGSMLFCVGCAVIGQINFKFGTRVTRLCALVCFTVGGLLIAFTSHDIPWLIFPGLTLLGVGGIPILMTNMQFSMLFSKGSSTVVSILSGAYDASSGVILIVKLLYERGVALQWSMIVITCFYGVTLFNTFLFLPRDFISKEPPQPAGEDPMDFEGAVELIVKNNTATDLPADAKDSPDTEKAALKEKERREAATVAVNKELPTLQSCIFTPVYWLHVVWLSILQLRFYYFLGSLNTWLTELLGTKEEVSFYTNVCLYAMMCGLVTSPLAGIIYDVFKRIYAHSRSQLRRDLMPAVIPLAFTSLLGILVSVLVLINTKSILYPTFVFNVVFRSFIYALGAAYIGVMFPSEYFGILYGLMIIIAGVISLVQYGLFSWQEVTGVISVNGFFIAFNALSLVHPVYQWITCHRAESQVVIEE